MSRPTASLHVQLVTRRQALGQILGATAAVGVVACSTDSDGPSLDLQEIPPITPTEDFYVTSCCGTPEVDGDSWMLSIRDPDGELASIDLAGLHALAGRDKEHTLECIGAWAGFQAIDNAIWTGLPVIELLDALGVQVPDSAVELKLSAADDYSTSIPVTDLDRPIWLVWQMNGEPLTVEHGYPVRLLVPGRYGIKNPKWLTELAFIDEPFVGYWESRGWSQDATYKPNTFVSSPYHELEHEAGPLRFLGTAFAGSDPIDSVDISFDGGESWTPITIDYSPGADIWTLWHHDWDAEPGQYDVRVRCTTVSGAQSGPETEASYDQEGYDGSMQVEVIIT